MFSLVTIGFLLIGLLMIILIIRVSEITAQINQMEERVNDRITHIDLEQRLKQEARGMAELNPDRIKMTKSDATD